MPETIILVGDALSRLKDLDDNTFNVVVTSPPYFGLRDYGTAGDWLGGTDPACDHVRHQRAKVPQGLQGRSAREVGQAEAERLGATVPDDVHNRYPTAGRPIGNGKFKCDLCGAIKTDLQIGLEPTPQDFVDTMVDVCRGIKRVLRPDGTFWLNIGDSFNSGRDGGHAGGSKQASLARHEGINRSGANVPGLKPKDMIGIPWMLAFALQADGWYIRSEIIWAKTSAMPESITDRPTVAHERIFLLTKQPNYFFDGYAVEDLSISTSPAGSGYERPHNLKPYGSDQKWNDIGGLRNMRSFWLLGPEATPDFHFATFVSEVPRRAILSGLGRAGVCAKCGSPWKSNRGRNWAPTCTCGSSKPIGGMVLDPFLGSGTTAMVANSLGHDCVGIELNPDNASQARQRIMADGRFTNSVTLDGVPNFT